MRTRKEILADIEAHSNEWGYIGLSDAVKIQVELLLDMRDLAFQTRLLVLRALRKNTVGQIASFSSAKKAELRLQEIVKTARFPVKVFKQTRRGRVLFAENTETRIPPNAVEGTVMATFAIPEWAAVTQ